MIFWFLAAIYTVSQYSVDNGEPSLMSSEETCQKNVQYDSGTADMSALDTASKTQTANGECSKNSFANMIVKPASEGIGVSMLFFIHTCR